MNKIQIKIKFYHLYLSNLLQLFEYKAQLQHYHYQYILISLIKIQCRPKGLNAKNHFKFQIMQHALPHTQQNNNNETDFQGEINAKCKQYRKETLKIHSRVDHEKVLGKFFMLLQSLRCTRHIVFRSYALGYIVFKIKTTKLYLL